MSKPAIPDYQRSLMLQTGYGNLVETPEWCPVCSVRVSAGQGYCPACEAKIRAAMPPMDPDAFHTRIRRVGRECDHPSVTTAAIGRVGNVVAAAGGNGETRTTVTGTRAVCARCHTEVTALFKRGPLPADELVPTRVGQEFLEEGVLIPDL